MATYLVLVNWTDQGAAGFEHTTDRVDHEEEIRKRAGVELKEIYWTQGPYDLAAIIEAEDDESIAAAMLGIQANGNSRTTTLRAFQPRRVPGDSREAQVVGELAANSSATARSKSP